MSKVIKSMEMAALKQSFGGVRNMVLLSATRIDAGTDHAIRSGLRGQKIRLQMVKNSLARRVLAEDGIELKDVWSGTTLFAWGGESIKDLSKAIEKLIADLTKKNPKLKENLTVKAAIAEGEQVPFAEALKMPTRQEIIGELVGMILGPGSAIAGALTGPASQVASQIQTISEKKDEAAPADTPVTVG
jgi:large subunit ribosomal protein L10